LGMTDGKEEYAQLVKALNTPYRLGRPVLEPTAEQGDFDSKMVDCPFVFFHDGHWWMTYVGFDGEGYRTGLAFSRNLIDWERKGVILDWGNPGSFDAFSAAGTWILRENVLLAPPNLRRWNGLFWMAYCGFARKGYEVGPGAVGLAYSKDLFHWERFEANPILKSEDGAHWENGGLFKPCIVQHIDNGENFYLYYNARDKSDRWIEQTGFAASSDLRNWRRFRGNPVIRVGFKGSWDSRFVSDPFVARCRNTWVAFYYGFDGVHAQDGIAFSKDLRNWKKWSEPILKIGPPGSVDSQHAHKPCIVRHNGVLYHFYCAVRARDGYRTISVATSKPVTHER